MTDIRVAPLARCWGEIEGRRARDAARIEAAIAAGFEVSDEPVGYAGSASGHWTRAPHMRTAVGMYEVRWSGPLPAGWRENEDWAIEPIAR